MNWWGANWCAQRFNFLQITFLSYFTIGPDFGTMGMHLKIPLWLAIIYWGPFIRSLGRNIECLGFDFVWIYLCQELILILNFLLLCCEFVLIYDSCQGSNNRTIHCLKHSLFLRFFIRFLMELENLKRNISVLQFFWIKHEDGEKTQKKTVATSQTTHRIIDTPWNILLFLIVIIRKAMKLSAPVPKPILLKHNNFLSSLSPKS